MYTHVVADLYSEALAGGQLNLRSAHDSFSQTVRVSCEPRCRLVFVLVALPPPPVTSPATRLKACALSDFCYFKADHFHEARLRFYPRRSGKSCDSPGTKPFGFSVRCNSHNSRLLSLSNNASPLCSPIPSLVSTPVSTATGCGLYAPVKSKSSRKYFNDVSSWLWKKLWKTLRLKKPE
jgi:hypothetical protein